MNPHFVPIIWNHTKKSSCQMVSFCFILCSRIEIIEYKNTVFIAGTTVFPTTFERSFEAMDNDLKSEGTKPDAFSDVPHTSLKPPIPSNHLPIDKSTFVLKSLAQTIAACEPILMSRIRLEPPFVNRIAAEGVIPFDFAKALLQVTDGVASRLALLKEIINNGKTNQVNKNDDKLCALSSAFK